MSPALSLPYAAAESGGTGLIDTIGTPTLWAVSIAGVLALLAVDFVVTRKPHEVSMREAIGWSAFYIALPVAFGLFLLAQYGSERGVEYYTGYLVEKSLSVDNLFVFMLLLTAFAVPNALQQRVLLYGIIGALVLRSIFIALGAAALANFTWVFLVFGLVLLLTGAKLMKDTLKGDEHTVDVENIRVVKLARRFMPVTNDYDGTKMVTRLDGVKHLTPFALVIMAVFMTDIVFAIDSVPAVYGITNDPYLVFITNAFALLGLRALYFVLQGAVARLVHLGFGLAAILGFIGVKLVLHWAHTVWTGVPEIPTLLSLGVIVGILALVTATSLYATRDAAGSSTDSDEADDATAADDQAAPLR